LQKGVNSVKRKYLSKLEEWIQKPDRKPLMVWGARQVGKSYLVEELFAKKFFKDSF
jgi:predicted AAA+ superfamily ATPase